jgi:tetratricopeptide (TPR) repeat protein
MERQSVEASKQLALQQAGENCDRAAANPTDGRRPSTVPGVEYSDLKANAQSAADTCALAVRMHPEEPRYRYNSARALENINPQQAINIYAELVKQNYVAAYDNFAGVIWRERKDLPGAIKLWETGVRAGDPGAMVSLAYLIKRNLYQVPDPVATRQALLTKAAQAGHRGAQDMLDQDQQEFQAHVYQQQNQQAQQQMMLNLFGPVVRGMVR